MENNKNKKPIKRTFQGIVVSDKMNKTIVVRVDRIKCHPKYKKRYKVSKRYKVHDSENKCKTGDKVTFVECRPLSKEKRWRVK
jgi:small subunit ribosomal protein S17